MSVLLSKNAKTTLSEKKSIVALAREMRLANNYTFTENLEKLGNAELASFDLFRTEKAKAKRFRQRLIEKLDILMGNDKDFEIDPFKDMRSSNPFVEVEVDGLGLENLQVPINDIQLSTVDDENVTDIGTLLTKEIKNVSDLQANPVALAMLGMGESKESSDTGYQLMGSVAEAPVDLLNGWINPEKRQIPEFSDVKVSDLKEVFLQFLQNRNVCVFDSINPEDFVEMQLKQSLADVLAKESFNEEDLVEYLGQRSHRGLKKEFVMEGFENLLFDKVLGLEGDPAEAGYLLEDLTMLRDLAEVDKFDVPAYAVRKVLYNYEKIAHKLIKLNELGPDATEEQKWAIAENEDYDKDMTYAEEIIEHDTEFVHPDEHKGRPAITEKKDILLEMDDLSDPEFDEKHIDVYRSDDESYESEEVDPMTQYPESEHEIPTHFNRVGLEQNLLTRLIYGGLFTGVEELHHAKIFEGIELQRLARESSTSRMKQFLLMFKVAETQREREFCLQRLRKELLSFDKFDLRMLEEKKNFKPFELFVDSLARQMETASDSKLGNVVRGILNRKSVSSKTKAAFQDFVQINSGDVTGQVVEFGGSGAKDQRESANLQLSTRDFSELMDSVGTPSIEAFLQKVRLAYSGQWDPKGKNGRKL